MRVLSILLALALASAASVTHAAWPESPTGLAINTAFSDQHLPVMLPDGQGGALVVWADLRSGDHDVYAQRITSAGQPLWAAAGVIVCSASGQQVFPVIVPDAAGGMIVLWEDDRSGTADVYAQRVSATGQRLWAAGGVPLCTAIDDQVELSAVSDGAGGAIVAWTDLRKGTEADVYAQRVNASGVVQWATNGVAVAALLRDQYGPRVAHDGATGAFVTWSDTRTLGRQDVYVARLTSAGMLPWAAGGVRVAITNGGQAEPEIAGDAAGGVYVAWADGRNGPGNIAVQRVNGIGARTWGDSARVICAASGAQGSPQLARLASGPCVVWEDGRGASPDLYGQRLDVNGIAQWQTDGRLLAGGSGAQDRPRLLAGSGDECLLVWQDRRSGSLDVYAQRVAADGTERWATGGLAVCAMSGEQRYPVLASDGVGGLLTVWEDQRDFAPDLYGHRVLAGGLLGGPEPRITALTDVPGDEGGALRVEWQRSRYEDAAFGSTVRSYRIERLDANAVVAVDSVDVTFGDGPPQLAVTVPTLRDATPTSTGRTAVRVIAVAGASLYIGAPDSSASLDNVGPAAVSGLSARIEGATTRLSWSRSASPDAVQARVYRGSFVAFATDSASLVATTADSVLVLAHATPAYYKVVAVDDNGNAGAQAWAMSEATLDTPPAALEFAFARPAPDPSHGSLTFAFTLAAASEAQLELFDTRGRRVRALHHGALAAGRHTIAWDGRDAAGRPLAAGVYHARLRAGAQVRTHRLTRLR